jgi:5-methylcytosine-specific restriction protein B
MAEAKSNRFTKYFPHILDALRTNDPQPMRPAEVIAWVRDHVAVPEQDTSRTVENGRQTIFENDVHWGRFYLAKAGLIAKPKHGLWGLTPAGRDSHLTPATTWDLYVRIRDANRPGAADDDTIPAPETDVEESQAFWFVGAVWDRTDDQTERFLRQHVWINGNDDKANKDLVARMKRGDRIAIKAAFVQKKGLPFDVGGAAVSCMRIKATGVITGNKGDGKTVTVDWDPPANPRAWYFYTYRDTLHEADPEDERGRKLIDFTFKGTSQDHEWWLKRPYFANKYSSTQATVTPPTTEEEDEDEGTDNVTEISDAPTYTLNDIVADGSFLAKRLGYALIGSKARETTRSRLRVVQFHPSLAYEDFVRGWRPKGKEGLDLVDGIFMQAIEAASSEPDREFVLVIEEINRGNPAQIFGELLTLVEVGKRRREEALELAYRRSPDERVFVPDNLYVIGTMNIADRSLALVDLALRRRFTFVDLEPRFAAEWRAWCEKRGLVVDLIDLIEERIRVLNAAIAAAPSLGPQFRIGHSYATPEVDEVITDGRAWFRAKVETEIGPLLDEYWYDAPENAKKARADLLIGL